MGHRPRGMGGWAARPPHQAGSKGGAHTSKVVSPLLLSVPASGLGYQALRMVLALEVLGGGGGREGPEAGWNMLAPSRWGSRISPPQGCSPCLSLGPEVSAPRSPHPQPCLPFQSFPGPQEGSVRTATWLVRAHRPSPGRDPSMDPSNPLACPFSAGHVRPLVAARGPSRRRAAWELRSTLDVSARHAPCVSSSTPDASPADDAWCHI